MAGILPILIIIVAIVVRKGQNKAKQSGTSYTKPKPQPVSSKPVNKKVKVARSKSSSARGFNMPKTAYDGKKDVEIGTLKDDRKNDWLARQLKEEQAVLRRREYLDLGAAHSKNCAADSLKTYHEENCDADKVDTGIY